MFNSLLLSLQHTLDNRQCHGCELGILIIGQLHHLIDDIGLDERLELGLVGDGFDEVVGDLVVGFEGQEGAHVGGA